MKNKIVFWKIIKLSAIVSGANILLHILLFSIILKSIYYLDILLIPIIIFYMVSGGFLAFFLLLLFRIKKIKYIPTFILITSGLLISLILGMLGIPPFGIWGFISDWGMPMPTFLIILLLSPLILIFLILRFFIKIELSILPLSPIGWLVMILILLGYFYLLSKVIIYFYIKIKRKKRKDV